MKIIFLIILLLFLCTAGHCVAYVDCSGVDCAYINCNGYYGYDPTKSPIDTGYVKWGAETNPDNRYCCCGSSTPNPEYVPAEIFADGTWCIPGYNSCPSSQTQPPSQQPPSQQPPSQQPPSQQPPSQQPPSQQPPSQQPPSQQPPSQPPLTGSITNSIILVFDASGSMSGEKIVNAKAGAIAAISPLGPETEVALIVFSGCGNINLEQPFTTDKSAISSKINQIQPSSGTPLYDAIDFAEDYKKNANSSNVDIIVFTDGEDSCGRSTTSGGGTSGTPPVTPTVTPSGGVGGSTGWYEFKPVKKVYGTLTDAQGLPLDMVFDYSGMATYDGQKATMKFTISNGVVTGSLYKEGVCAPNIRLNKVELDFTGTLMGTWENGGTITGNWNGNDYADSGQYSCAGWRKLTEKDGYPVTGTFTITMETGQTDYVKFVRNW